MKPVTKETFKILWHHAIRYRIKLFVIVTVISLTVVTDLLRPFLYRELFNRLSSPDPSTAQAVLWVIMLIVALGVVHSIFWRIIAFVNIRFQARIMSDLLNTAYRHLHHHSIAFFDSNFVGSIVTKVRRYSGAFETIADIICFDIGRTALRTSAIVVVLFIYRPIFGFYMLVWSIVYVGFSYGFSRWKLQYDLAKAEQDTKTTAHLADTVTNHQNIKLFASYSREVTAFEQITEKLYRLRKRAWDLAQYAEIFQGVAMILLELVVMYTAYRYWLLGQLTIGDFALLQGYLYDIFSHLWDLGRHIRAMYESIADANEMTEILLQPHAIVDIPGAQRLMVQAGGIEFKNINFHYHVDTPILTQFNLTIAPGERVALVGQSGGGKSTIVKALFRFMDIQGGSITVDGQNIARVTQDSLREQISLVPQEPILFHRSLLENIRYGKLNATEAEVIAAAKLAHCHEFIETFEHTYDTFVGERGVKLSGGERQRVAIARAILKNAPILVLDEATSSLDSESEYYIQDALKTLMKGKTTIVIAHRLSTIREMDRIVVIEGGKIVEQGKHEELVKAEQGIYQKLWGIQVGGFSASANSV